MRSAFRVMTPCGLVCDYQERITTMKMEVISLQKDTRRYNSKDRPQSIGPVRNPDKNVKWVTTRTSTELQEKETTPLGVKSEV